MKLFPVAYKPEVQAIFRLFASRYRIADADFVSDLFTVIRKNGACLTKDKVTIMDRAQVEAVRVKSTASTVNLVFARRMAFLRQMYVLPGVQQSLKAKANPLDTAEHCLELYRRTFALMREAQCKTCQLLPSCAFGKQYGAEVRDIRTVKDPDYARKVHDDCPLRPSIEAENNMAEAAALRAGIDGAALQAAGVGGAMGAAAQDAADAAAALGALPPAQVDDGLILDEDPFEPEDKDPSGAGKRAGKGVTHAATASRTGSSTIIKDTFIDKLTTANLCIYMLSLRFEALLNSHKPGTYSPTQNLMPDAVDRNIKSVNEVTKVKLSEHLKSDELFERQMHTKELQTTQHLEEDEKKQLLYVLIDTSPSMRGALTNASPHAAYLERNTLASALSLALVRKVEREGGIIFVRNFDTGVGPLKSSAASGFQEVVQYIVALSYNGNGTEIYNAISRAIKDISGKVAKHIDTAEILVVTDVEDSDLIARSNQLKIELGSIALNILDVSGGKPQTDTLGLVADNYMAVDPKNPSLESIISVVGGKKTVVPTK